MKSPFSVKSQVFTRFYQMVFTKLFPGSHRFRKSSPREAPREESNAAKKVVALPVAQQRCVFLDLGMETYPHHTKSYKHARSILHGYFNPRVFWAIMGIFTFTSKEIIFLQGI